MIVYSHARASSDGIVVLPTLFDPYPGLGVVSLAPIPPNPAGRYPYQVDDPPAALLSDWNFPQVQPGDVAAPTSLAAYRNAMMWALNTWHGSWVQGVTYNGTTYRINANPDSQVAFDKFLLALQNLPDPTKQVQLWQSDGSKVLLAASDVVAILKLYGAALIDRENGPGTGFNDLELAIAVAQSAADLDAVSFSPADQ